jgi:protein O-GlcNAc transferase
MTKAAIQQALQTAANLAKAGRAPEAESIYRQILTAHPKEVGALFGYGVLLQMAGHAKEALELLRQAATENPNDADVRNAFGAALVNVGQLAEGEAAFRRAIALRPGLAGAHENLTSVLCYTGRFPEALAAGERALVLAPKSAQALLAVAQAMVSLNKLPESIAMAERAIAVDPPAYRAHELVGHALMGMGRADEAIEAYRRAVSPQPGFAVAYSNLGNALQQRARTAEAMPMLEMAIRLDPNLPDARNNYGNALKDLARLDEACEQYRIAVRQRPSTALFGSNLVYAMWFRQACDPAEVLAESRAWAAYHAEPLTAAAPPHNNDRNPDRKIRVGLVSPDFRFHPVGRLIQPLVAHYDRSQIEIVLFSGVVRPDDLSKRMYADATAVVDVRATSDEQLAAHVRNANIDVLVDLQLHMSGTRLRTFAMRPAPVEITYLGYCATSGMTGMDYVLTDRTMDPWEGPDPDGGAPSPIHSEKLLHLDGCYWCYGEPPNIPEPNPLPALANDGAVTFGSLNSFTKLNDGVFDVWAEILRRVPNSRLFLVVPGGPQRQENVRQMWVHRGIAGDRIRMTEIVGAFDYFLLYNQVDIALDPFPYAGGTTTMDALYMGVPVVTLAGRWALGRAGVTLLRAAGLPQWITQTSAEYVDMAASLAADLPALAERRRTLRDHLRASPLMDGPRFAADVGRAFRRAWRYWCANGR